ncbi:hypothetical protein ACN2CC_02025 [Mesorhizobium muleiense]|uniref:hypothetical protein n=1 Tax=Mesorhizobium muleiense TaxID=1004279 RepID=UPI003AFA2ECD
MAPVFCDSDRNGGNAGLGPEEIFPERRRIGLEAKMEEYGILDVLHLMEDLGIDRSNVDRFLSRTLAEYESGEIDEELYFLRVASILSNARPVIDGPVIDMVLLPWKETGLERCCQFYSFWLLVEQFHHNVPHNITAYDDLSEWFDRDLSNSLVSLDTRSYGQIALMLNHCWFGDKLRNRICLWILYNVALKVFYNVTLEEMRSRPVPRDLLDAAVDHISRRLGRDGLGADIVASLSGSTGGEIAAD